MKPLLGPVRLRALAGASAHRVSWLELFFDLIFVAAVAQVAEPLREHYTADGILRFALLFALIWWAWTGYTVFATRFDADDGVQALLTVIQIFVVAAMAANARDALDSRSSAGFAAAYAVLRFLLVAQYVRARHLPGARSLTTRYISGHGAAAVLWLASSLAPPPWRYWIWAIALVIDLGTPWIAIPHNVRVPPTAAHLPERFGLFTLILLGEAVVAVMKGMESQETWPVSAAVAAFLGMGLLFLMWWWYFDAADAVAEQHVRTHRDAVRVHIWSYAHFPLYLGIVVTGVGMQRLITIAARGDVAAGDVMVMAAASAGMMAAMAVIAATSAGSHRRLMPLVATVALALVTAAAGAGLPPSSPVVLVGGLAAIYAAQAALAARTRLLPQRAA